jgi:hypothetical protein
MCNYNIISDEKLYLKGKRIRDELKKAKKEEMMKVYVEKCRKLAEKWRSVFVNANGYLDIEDKLWNEFKKEVKEQGIKDVIDVIDLIK